MFYMFSLGTVSVPTVLLLYAFYNSYAVILNCSQIKSQRVYFKFSLGVSPQTPIDYIVVSLPLL